VRQNQTRSCALRFTLVKWDLAMSTKPYEIQVSALKAIVETAP
jgi:hypothetical protein